MMKKRIVEVLVVASLVTCLFTGCGDKKASTKDTTKKETPTVATTEAVTETPTEAEKCDLEDGVYTAEFNTDSAMFHVNETCDGKGTLTVKDGKMTIHITLVSKKILNLYAGLAEDAQKEGATLLQPTTDSVTYSDGTTEEVFGFDLPVPALDKEFDCALIGEKGTWYDHKVTVSNPVAKEEAAGKSVKDLGLENGTYETNVELEGGSGRASVTSPCEIKVSDDGCIAVIEWSSPNYDFMMVNEKKYLPVNTDGNSVFEIPFDVFDAKVEVQADTVAMSKPHLIDYTLTFDSNVVKK